MGMLDKFKFWKKGDEFSDLDLDSDLGLGKESSVGAMDFSDNKVPSSMPEQPPAYDSEFSQPEPIRPDRGMDPFAQPKAPVNNQMGQNQTPPFAQGNDMIKKDLEIISVKLDALKSSIETLTHKVSSLEQKDKRW